MPEVSLAKIEATVLFHMKSHPRDVQVVRNPNNGIDRDHPAVSISEPRIGMVKKDMDDTETETSTRIVVVLQGAKVVREVLLDNESLHESAA